MDKKKSNSLTFESALILLNEHKVADKDFQEDVKQKVDYFREKSKVLNTERSTKNWIKKFNDFRKAYGYLIPLSELSDIKQLEKELVEYISIMKKNDGKEYKANSIKQAVDAIDRYLRIHSPISHINLHDKYMFPDLINVLHGRMQDLQERGLGEVTGSLALNTEQVQQILQHPRMNCEEPENLLYRVFFLISILFAMRGGEHYNIKIDQFKFDNCGLKFSRYTSKNNQRGLHNGSAHIITIPADSGSYSDIKLYLSKRPICEESSFYLQPNSNWLATSIWYKSNHIGKNKLSKFMQDIGRQTQIDISFDVLSNHSGRKTAAQYLQDNNVPEQAIMELTGHKSVEGVRAYKKINEEQKSFTINTLINITDNTKNQLKYPLQEISPNSIDNNSSRTPIFNNCTFSNVTFNIQKQ
ncbi:hypothetical protein Glove_29g82 [Diversispora epigaea]|uniref:Tyr recombinase domain-containing protein n=1 Tax=Diversispora epigaea TaxID=1348612 RepID=A0A397JM29_9GLOM|nr:hypothetical protein Glove_29g82 [Diversispora epigaea]